jgi:hypothetical protein
MSNYRSRRWIIGLSCILALLALPSLARGQSCDIDGEHVGPVRLGESKSKIRAQLSARYAVTEPEQNSAVPTLIARRRGDGTDSRPLVLVNFLNDRAFLIDSFEFCVTKEGVGPGATLGRANDSYGQGRIDPTELGYFVWFDRKEGVRFLLDDRDIPSSLRGIPDDALTPDRERQILSLRNVRIVAVRVTGS